LVEESSRYKTILKLASGGNATVWIGAVRGSFGFRQLVAIKKPHPHLLEDPSLRAELLAEARLASLIQHANVVDIRDVNREGDDFSLVMDYIEGASLHELLVTAVKRGKRVPPRVVIRIVLDACAGLHAAHELKDERNRPIGLVHRDVSPQNILIGLDGIARVADFGIAKFKRRNAESTGGRLIKGKLAYMAPEYVNGQPIDRRLDIFALGAVLWEGLAWTRCFRGANDAETLKRITSWTPPPISQTVPGLGPELDQVVAMALAKSRDDRFETAAALANALATAAGAVNEIADHAEVAESVTELVGKTLDERRAIVRASLAGEPSIASMFTQRVEELSVPTPTERQVSTLVVEAWSSTEMTPGGSSPFPIAPTPPPAPRPSPRPPPAPPSARWVTILLVAVAVASVLAAIFCVAAVARACFVGHSTGDGSGYAWNV
jgi:serine/threonine-protein kinase